MNSPVVKSSSQIIEKVLFVDDEPQILRALKRLFKKESFECLFAESGPEALEIMDETPIDLIVSDMRMPRMNGAEFLSLAREKAPSTKSILLTGHSDITSTIEALNKGGIYRYISKPWEDEDLKRTIEEALKVKRLERERNQLLVITHKQNKKLKSFNSELESKVEERTQELNRTMGLLDKSYSELIDSYDTFIRVFSTVVSSRFQTERQRPAMVGELAGEIAEMCDLPEHICKQVAYAGLLHELGKISLPDEVLDQCESKLSDEHFKQYRKYPTVGASILMSIKGLDECARFINEHMENLDGTGFPKRLDRQEISYGAKILRIAKDFVGLQLALLFEAPRDANGAFAYIKSRSGKVYETKLVNKLHKLVGKYDLCNLAPNESAMEVMALHPGMITARDVVNNYGILLIAKGRMITEKNIEQLATIETIEECKLRILIENSSIENK
ncbi:HD domain-containing phosphohydrolase [Litoribrevibacter albus]|uniref:Two-component system response regulator n=1 Tax=Litoribrevibacter albus TaxID=1473156 RepID=A0AA37SAI3_9GAMM|nr:HD domain-containing phosphohydrolase [Litoribrevibacter albus]GLQ31779.1 two-component system response regulator [Litoribrevibacter albus]